MGHAKKCGSMETLQSGVRLSKSALGELLRQYYEQKGIRAWERTPYYVTSNTYIANSYARIITRYLQDTVNKNLIDLNEPIYILELGAGTGQFGYLFVKALYELLPQLNLDHLNVCYLLTDTAQSNVDFWTNHRLWQPFFTSAKVFNGQYNLENEVDITFHSTNELLDPKTCKNPLIAIGNYVFDTLSQDAFYIEGENIFECLVELLTKEGFKDKMGNIDFDKIDINFQRRKIDINYYDKSIWNQVLEYFANNLDNSSLLLPVGAFKCIQNLMRISNDRLFLLVWHWVDFIG
jgi:SAM-dependent MidA family methyltransferase